MFKKIKNKKGFTLIELIVVIAILAVLAAIIIPTVANSLTRAQQGRDLANSRSIYAREVIRVLNAEVTTDVTGLDGPQGLTCDFTIDDVARTILTFECEAADGTVYALNPTTGEIENPNP